MPEAQKKGGFHHYEMLCRADGSLWELGRGGMAITYKAFDTNLRCEVALKLINATFLDNELARRRFVREAQAAAQLRHPNVASVYHLGVGEEGFFYAMEFIEGETVDSFVRRRGPVNEMTGLNIIRQVSSALAAAAKQNLVHRDIKPANLMLVHDEDEEEVDARLHVKVIDFGLAKSLSQITGIEGNSISMTGSGFVGTIQYASPEQLEEKDLDARSDIYSLGVTFWYMLTGNPPFTGSAFSVSAQHLHRPPPWEQVEHLQSPVRDLLALMLHKSPAERPQNAVELRRCIQQCRQAILALKTAPGAASAVAQTATPGVAPLIPAPPPSTVSDSDAAQPPPAAPGHASTASPFFTPAPTAVGAVLDDAYALDVLIDESDHGTIFLARDLRRVTGRDTVTVRVLPPDISAAAEVIARLMAEVRRVQLAPHAGLIEFLDFVGHPASGVSYLVLEPLQGFSLLDLLRARRSLTVPEALALLWQACAVAEHARRHELYGMELGLPHLQLHFPGGLDAAAKATVLDEPLHQWPEHLLKVNPLDLSWHIEPRTWAGDLTLIPGRSMGSNSVGRTLQRDTRASLNGPVWLPALGRLIYELLGGRVEALGGSRRGQAARYVALPSLSEDANELLRLTLTKPHQFTDHEQFFKALALAAGFDPAAFHRALLVPEPRPRLTPPAPEIELPPPRNSETNATVQLDSAPEPAAPFEESDSAVPIAVQSSLPDTDTNDTVLLDEITSKPGAESAEASVGKQAVEQVRDEESSVWDFADSSEEEAGSRQPREDLSATVAEPLPPTESTAAPAVVEATPRMIRVPPPPPARVAPVAASAKPAGTNVPAPASGFELEVPRFGSLRRAYYAMAAVGAVGLVLLVIWIGFSRPAVTGKPTPNTAVATQTPPAATPEPPRQPVTSPPTFLPTPSPTPNLVEVPPRLSPGVTPANTSDVGREVKTPLPTPAPMPTVFPSPTPRIPAVATPQPTRVSPQPTATATPRSTGGNRSRTGDEPTPTPRRPPITRPPPTPRPPPITRPPPTPRPTSKPTATRPPERTATPSRGKAGSQPTPYEPPRLPWQ